MLTNTSWHAYGPAWADVARRFARWGMQARALHYFRLMYLDDEARPDDTRARAQYPLCRHGRRTVTLWRGQPLCDCEGVEAARQIGRMCKGVKSDPQT